MQPKKKKTSKEAPALPSPFAAVGKSLLYMYVEDFLGFHQQSFNFAMAPRFQMLARGEERILQRAEPLTQLEDYWEDHSFFGENITALSLLIGENGSGKTTVFRLLLSWLRVLANGKLPTQRGALVFRETRENNQHEYSYVCFPAGTEIDVAQQQFSMKKMEAEDARRFLRDVSFTYYTDTMTDLELLDQDLSPEKEESEGQFIDRSLNARLCDIPIHPGQKHLSRYELRRLDFAFQVKHLLRQTQPGEGPRAIPIDYLRVSVPSDFKRTLLCKLLKELQSGEHAALADFESLYATAESCFQAWKKLTDGATEQQAVQLAFIEGVLWSFVTLVLQNIGGTPADTIHTLVAGLFRINVALIREAESGRNNEETLKVIQTEVQDYIGNVSRIDISEGNALRDHTSVERVFKNLAWIIKLSWTEAIHSENEGKRVFMVGVPALIADQIILDIFKEFVDEYSIIPDAASFIELEWSYVSSGEDNRANLFSVLSESVTGIHNQWIFLDEPDNSFHPKWKQEILCCVVACCAQYKSINFQFWISSHSPIMLSDAPAQAAVLLKREEQGTGKINMAGHKQLLPFAQQIYTLFDDGFFLEKGVVGSFAGETIHALNEALQKIEQSRATTKQRLAPQLEKLRPLLAQVQEPVLRGYLINRFRFCEAKIKSLK